jgi:hypothetical protein
MREIPCYTIGRGEISNLPGNPTGVVYIPDHESYPIGVWEYAPTGRGSSGSGYSFQDCMKNFAEKPTWFRRLFRDANAEWFIPFIERMAAGEKVPFEEIEARHFELFGEPLEFTLIWSD